MTKNAINIIIIKIFSKNTKIIDVDNFLVVLTSLILSLLCKSTMVEIFPVVLTSEYDTSNMAVSQKSKFFTTKGTKDFHKEHKALLNNILYLCPLCVLCVLCGKINNR